MKHLCLLVLLLSSTVSIAQEIQQPFLERIEYCDLNLSDEQVGQLRFELDRLENYLVHHGLLKDKSGESYRSVYEQIARDNDLLFVVDTSFVLLDSLDFEILSNCFYKVLKPEQMAELTPRHQAATERISTTDAGPITPGIVAQRFLDHLAPEDFGLEFYRVSSLLAFHQMALPDREILEIFTRSATTIDTAKLAVVHVLIDQHNEVLLEGKKSNLADASKFLLDFLKKHPLETAIELKTERSALYSVFLEVKEMIYSVYNEVEKEVGYAIPRNLIIPEPQ